jgi:glutamate synthase (NADPH/NADH) large chain
MTVYDNEWVASHEQQRKWMDEHSLYREEDEHSSCGVGLVVSQSTASRRARWWRTGSTR